MTAKKPSSTASKKNTKKEDVIDVKLEELMPPTASIGITCRLMMLLSFAGIALLVYDRVEPGKIPFFAEPQKPVCENPIHEIADQVNSVLKDFSSQIRNTISDAKPIETPIDIEELVGSINNSKNEIIDSISQYAEGFKNVKQESQEQVEKKMEKAIVEAKTNAAEDSKKEIVIDLAFNKINSILKKKSGLDKNKESLAAAVAEVKKEILSSVKVDEETAQDVQEGDEITNSIKGALSKFVKVRKVDDSRIMLEQLFLEAEELIAAEEFEALTDVLTEIRSISGNIKVDSLIQESRNMESFEDQNIKENLKEVLNLIEKLKTKN